MLIIVLAVLVTSASAVMDLRSGRIDNLWLLTGAFLAPAAHLAAGQAERLPDCFFGAVLPVILLFPLFYIRALGAGDIKLFSVLGLFMGTRAVLLCILVSFAAGAVLAAGLLVSRGLVRQRSHYFIDYIRACAGSRKVLPYREGSCPDRSGETVYGSEAFLPGRSGIALCKGGKPLFKAASPELMHFTVPILAAVLLWAAGVYG